MKKVGNIKNDPVAHPEGMTHKPINRAVQCRMFLQLKRLLERAQYENVRYEEEKFVPENQRAGLNN